MLSATKPLISRNAVAEIVRGRQWHVAEIPARSGFALANKYIFYAIFCLSIIAITAFGGEPEWALLSLRLGAAGLFTFWLLAQINSGLKVQGNQLLGPMLAFAALVAIQILFGISVYRYATISAALQYVSCFLFFFLTVQCANSKSALRNAAVIVTLFGFVLALFGIIQDLTSNGRIFWTVKPGPQAVVYGPYVNHNHYAGLMEMLTPIPLVMSLSSLYSSGKRTLFAFAAILMASTIFLSGSRAGVLSFSIQLVLLTGVLIKTVRHRIPAVGGIALLIVALVFWLGREETLTRISTLQHPTKEADFSTRLRIARDSMRMIEAKPWLGWGLNSFAVAYPQYRSFYSDLVVGHAHSDYVQLAVETGIAGLTLVIWFLGCLYRGRFQENRFWRYRGDCAVRLGALVGCTGIVVHSLADFNMQIPANATFFFILCALATTRASESRVPEMKQYDERDLGTPVEVLQAS